MLICVSVQLTWLSNRDEIAEYLHEVHINCLVVIATINQIAASNKKISGICAEIGSSYLVELEKKKVYEITEFDEKQLGHRIAMREKLERSHASIKETIELSYEKCSSDMEEVRIAWDEYRRRVNPCALSKVIFCSKTGILFGLVVLLICMQHQIFS